MKNPEFLIEKGVDLQTSLELFGDIETYNETVGEFIVSVENKINKLQAYLTAKDMTNYAIYVHSLKSDAKYFGFKTLADLAYEHEQKSKAGDIFYISQNINNLIMEATLARDIIKEYLQEGASTSSVLPGQVYIAKTILVVDDSNIIRNFTKRIFDGQYEVGMAKDGQEAINILAANKSSETIVAMLLDLNMPIVDGFKVLEYMQENNLFSKIPVSIITGDSTKETIDKAYKYPIIDMLEKPFNDQDVKRVVEKTIMYKELS